jgi:hypothetical protein
MGKVWAVYSPVWGYDRWVEVGYGGLVSEFNEFEPIGRVTVDDRRRVPLGQTDVAPGARFTVYQAPDGSILLRPVQSGAAKAPEQ